MLDWQIREFPSKVNCIEDPDEVIILLVFFIGAFHQLDCAKTDCTHKLGVRGRNI